MRVLLAFTLLLPLGAQPPDYEKQVLPVLKTNCFACHAGKNVMSGLVLDSREGLLTGGNRGSAIDAQELLVKAVRQEGALKMPPGRKLKPEQIEVIEQWVKSGAPMPDHLLKTKRKGADHWAFQPIGPTAAPAVSNPTWPCFTSL